MRAHGIELDVSIAGEDVGVVPGDAGAEPAFPRRAGATMEFVDPADVAAAETVHQPRRRRGARRREQQMDVIGHEDIGVERAAGLGGDLGEIGEVGAPVGVVEEAGLAIDAALDEMDRHAGQQAARPAWHA